MRQKSNLSLKKATEKENRKREQSKERSRRFREKLQKDPARLEKRREENRVRRRKGYAAEKEERKNNPIFKEVCQAVWRQEKKKTKVVPYADFVKELPVNVMAQRRRRSLERKNVLLAKKKVEDANQLLKNKVKVLQSLLSRKRKTTSLFKEEVQLIQKMPRLSSAGLTNREKIAEQVRCSKRKRDAVLRKKRGKHIVWKYKVEIFLGRDYVSKPIPGSTVLDPRKVNKNRKFRQKKGCIVTKRVLLGRMKDLYKEYIAECPDFPYKFSTFSKMRPKHIVTAQKGTQKQKCICVYHSNMERKLSAINKFCKASHMEELQLNSTSAVIDVTLCEYATSHPSFKCLERSCTSCSSDKLMDHYIDLLGDVDVRSQSVQWTKWSTVERMKFDKRTGQDTKRRYNEVTRVTSTLEELLSATVDDLKSFPMHVFKSRWQWQQLHAIQTNLPDNDIIAIMDFSENIPLQFSEATIASHSKCFSLTLFPVAIYHHFEGRIEQEAVYIVSDDSQHDSHLVRSCMKTVMSHMKDIYPDKQIQTVHRYTDGCAGQFKSRHCMRDLSSFHLTHGCNIISNYGETSEFKNVCDGLGDHVKTPLKNAIIREDIVLSSPRSYYEYMKENMTFTPETREDHTMLRRSFYFINASDVDRKDEDTYGKVVSGLLKIRSVRGCSKGFIETRNVSCYCEFCLQEDFEKCLNKEYVDAWKKHHARKESGSCCSYRNPCQESTVDDQSQENMVDENLIVNANELSLNMPEESPNMKVENGSYVAVLLTGKRSSNIYMAKVVELCNEEVTLEYLEKGFGGSYVWCDIPERSEESVTNVFVVSEPKKITERGHYAFDLKELETIKSDLLLSGHESVRFA